MMKHEPKPATSQPRRSYVLPKLTKYGDYLRLTLRDPGGTPGKPPGNSDSLQTSGPTG